MFANNMVDELCWGLRRVVIKAEKEWKGKGELPVPLVSVDVNASVVHAVAQVEVTQVYVNKEEQPIETIYYFPINPEGAVTHFQAELDGQVIKGIVKSQDEAKEVYDKAVKNKTTAVLGEETKADIFKIRVGFLKPGAQVKVIIGYVTEVKNEPGTNAIRFYIPTTIAPRYVSPMQIEIDDKAKDVKNMEFSSSSPAPLSLKVAVSLQGKIKSIESPTHKVKVENTGSILGNQSWEKAIVELSGQTTDMDRDFVLNIVPEDAHKPRLYSEKLESGSTAMMLHLVPSFNLDEQKTEIIFVLDRSGSMSGKSINLAKKALLLFLHSMPADCYFNVVGFGSHYEFLFPKSVKYDDGSLKKAAKYAKDLKADMGGTEILEPLKKIYSNPTVDGYLRQIFLLTDGEVFDTDAVLGITQANAHKARVFALGIGDAASHELVEGIAKAGGGTAAFVTYNESIDKKVLNQLKNGLQPSLIDIELEWEGVDIAEGPEEPAVVINKKKTLLGYNKPMEVDTADAVNLGGLSKNNKQSPKRIPPVYDGSQLLVFGLFENGIPTAVTIRAQSPDGPLSVKIEHAPDNHVGSEGMLHRLAAVKLIRELELEAAAIQFQRPLRSGDSKKNVELLKKEIIRLGCQNGIASKHTSFIAVDVNTDKPSNENWVMDTRNVPSQFAHGWHGTALQTAYRSTAGRAPRMQLATKAARKCAPTLKKRSTAVAATGSVQYMAKAPRRSCTAVKRSTFSVDPQSSEEESATDDSDRSRSRSPPRRGSAKRGRSGVQAASDEDMDYKPIDKSAKPLVTLVSLQSFDGSFSLNDKLCGVLGKIKKDLLAAAKSYSVEESVLATALAIAFFTTKLPEDKDIWDLVVIKARKWLVKVKAITSDKADEMIKTIVSLL